MKFSYVAAALITGCLLVMVESMQSSESGPVERFPRQEEEYANGFMAQSEPSQPNSKIWMSMKADSVKPRNPEQMNQRVSPHAITLKTTGDKVKALRFKLLGLISEEAKQLSSNNQSIVSIAFLAFGVILFDVLTDAIFGDQSNLVASLVGGGSPYSRETMLPGLGLFGDNLNNLAEVALNMLTIYIYRDESPDCGERLLCESNQQAVSRGFLDSLVTYISGFSVSFFLRQAPISKNLEAMRAGRKGHNCVELYPRCSISL